MAVRDNPVHIHSVANECRIWVGCLASYNAGILHGEWIDVDGDGNTLAEAVQAMLKRSPAPNAEEWHIADHEGFGGVKIGGYESLETVAAWAELLEDHDGVCVKYAIGCGVTNPAEIGDFLEDAHVGHYESKQAYAEEHFGLNEMDDSDPRVSTLLRYMDWDRYIHGEIECAGYSFERDDDGVHVFQPV